MCQHVISLVEEFELSKTTGVINGKMADRIYRLVLACCYLGRQDILLEIRKNLPKDDADNLISRFQNTIAANLNAVLKNTQELSKKIDEHAAQSSAEHQAQDKKTAEHDTRTAEQHQEQDEKLNEVSKLAAEIVSKWEQEEKGKGKKKVTQKEALELMRQAHDRVYEDDDDAPEWSLTGRTLRNWNNGNGMPEGFTLNCSVADFMKWAVAYYCEKRDKRGLCNMQHLGEANKLEAKIYKQNPDTFRQESEG